MATLTPAQRAALRALIVRKAASHVGDQEVPRYSNRGPQVEPFSGLCRTIARKLLVYGVRLFLRRDVGDGDGAGFQRHDADKNRLLPGPGRACDDQRLGRCGGFRVLRRGHSASGLAYVRVDTVRRRLPSHRDCRRRDRGWVVPSDRREYQHGRWKRRLRGSLSTPSRFGYGDRREAKILLPANGLK